MKAEKRDTKCPFVSTFMCIIEFCAAFSIPQEQQKIKTNKENSSGILQKPHTLAPHSKRCRAPAKAGARRKESPRRRKAHMRASALRQPLRFLRLRLLFPKNLLLRKIFFGSPILWISSGASRRFLGKTEGSLCTPSAGSLVERGEQVLSWQRHGVALTTCELGNGTLSVPFPDRSAVSTAREAVTK